VTLPLACMLAGQVRAGGLAQCPQKRGLYLIEETLAREATVAEVARRYDVHPNPLHSWRRQAQQPADAALKSA
jgi:hypothetical protein